MKFVLYDDRPESKTKGKIQELILTPKNYCLVTVPPLIWNGFKGEAERQSAESLIVQPYLIEMMK